VMNYFAPFIHKLCAVWSRPDDLSINLLKKIAIDVQKRQNDSAEE